MTSPADGAARATAYPRMRRIATGLLALMTLIFVATSLLQARYPGVAPGLAYVRAFAEAAMVGACADWFAVVALFRRPFGLPIPHTAIVPSNKVRIGQSLGAFLCDNFLAPDEVTRRLSTVDAAGWAAHWLRQPGHAALVARRSAGLLPPLIELVGEHTVRTFGRDMIRRAINSIATAPLAGRMLSVAVAGGDHWPVFDGAIALGRDLLIKHRDSLRSALTDRSSGWLPGWLDGKLADRLLDSLTKSLTRAEAPDHPWRAAFQRIALSLADRLAHDAGLSARFDTVKADVLSSAVADRSLDWLACEVESAFTHHTAGDNALLVDSMERSLLALAGWIEDDTALRDLINAWASQAVVGTLVPNRGEIGAFVADVVANWDTDTLVGKLEAQVGTDLQYIRINGTLVGGTVGTLIYVAGKLLGYGE